MTKFRTLRCARPGAASPAAPAAFPPLPVDQASLVARHQAIENALSMALYWLRQDHCPRAVYAATMRAARATALLKQASAELQATNGGVR